MYDLLEPEIDKMKRSGIAITKELFPAELCDEIIGVYEQTLKSKPSYIHKDYKIMMPLQLKYLPQPLVLLQLISLFIPILILASQLIKIYS